MYNLFLVFCFSFNVRQCNIAYSVLHVQLYFQYFVSRLMFVSVISPVVLCMYNFVSNQVLFIIINILIFVYYVALLPAIVAAI